MNRPQAIVEALVAKAAEVLTLEPASLYVNYRGLAPAAGRMACWQVLREAGWTLVEIGEAFGRDHSTVSNQLRKSERRARIDPDHAYLVGELQRIVREDARRVGFATIEDRTRAQVWALDQEIAAAEMLRDELVTRIARAQRLRSELAEVLADFAPVITRGKGRQLQEASA